MLIAEPPPMPVAPKFALESAIAPKGKGLDPDARTSNIHAGCIAGADQVADGFVQGIGNPDVSEFPGAVEAPGSWRLARHS